MRRRFLSWDWFVDQTTYIGVCMKEKTPLREPTGICACMIVAYWKEKEASQKPCRHHRPVTLSQENPQERWTSPVMQGESGGSGRQVCSQGREKYLSSFPIYSTHQTIFTRRVSEIPRSWYKAKPMRPQGWNFWRWLFLNFPLRRCSFFLKKWRDFGTLTDPLNPWPDLVEKPDESKALMYHAVGEVEWIKTLPSVRSRRFSSEIIPSALWELAGNALMESSTWAWPGFLFLWE